MDAASLDQQIASLYGDIDWSSAQGLLHVASIVDSSRAVLAIGPAAPISATDRFVLGLARARAEVIVTTGAILRSEPTLIHRYGENDELDDALADWRSRVCGRSRRPALVVVSRSGDFPIDHPALREAETGIVWTSKDGARRIGSIANDLGHFSVADGSARSSVTTGLADSVASLIEEVSERLDARTILIEVGPTLARTFYPEQAGVRPRIDELLLSRFEGDVANAAIGPSFESESVLASMFSQAQTSVRVDEPSGTWCFERYR